MFTGIVTDLGQVRHIVPGGTTRFEMETAFDTSMVDIGASIACNGACMTVIEKGPRWFAFEASSESLAKTTMANWQVGQRINLERSMKIGDELGGHLVSGHVDGVGSVLDIAPDGEAFRFVFRLPVALAKYVAIKGSIAVDGVSLTVNDVEDDRFSVTVIPHTAKVTSLGTLQVGDAVNLEVDLLARYVARLLESRD